MIIGFVGKMGSGKSTAIEILQQRYGKDNVASVKFAGVLYELQETIYKRLEPVYKRPSNFVKDRKLLQFLGTEFGRGLDQDLWVKMWRFQTQKAFNDGLHIVVSDDVRFDNEAQTIKDFGGVVIQIDCDRAQDRITTANGIANHTSEAGIDKEYIDYTISNNGSLEEYREALCTLFDKLIPGQSK